MKKVFVTGANGFIGSHLCRDLSRRGYDVYGLVRPTSDLHFLDGVKVKLVRGDLIRPDGIDIPADMDTVIHSASVVSDWAGEKECREHITQVTANLLNVLERRGIHPRRFIYLSTALTLGYGRRDISEDRPGRPVNFMPYTRAKIKTEEMLRRRLREKGLPVVILRPADVFGPQDRTSCAIILRGLERGAPVIVGGGRWYFPYCYIDNLCLAVHKAMITPGVEGRTYTVTNGQLITWREFFTEIYGLMDKRQRVYVPVWAALAAGLIQQTAQAVFNRYRPSLNIYRIKRITSHTTYDISRTVRELDYRPDQDWRPQVRAIVEWYLEEKRNGFLP